MEQNLSDLLAEGAAAVGVPLGEKEISAFTIYYREILAWSRRINLVSLKAPRDLIIKHFIDSLTVVPFLPHRAGRLLDIGSGGGFPAIPIKIALPQWRISLLEATRKKTSFLKHMIRQLALRDAEVLHMRTEALEASATHHGAFDVVVSRALFKLPALLTIATPFLAPGGCLIAMKGGHVAGEIQQAMAVLEKAGLQDLQTYDIRLPHTGEPRKIIICK